MSDSVKPIPRTIACWCSGADDDILAVIRLTQEAVDDLLAKRVDYLRQRETNPTLRWLEFDNEWVRLYGGYHDSLGDPDGTKAAAVEAFLEAAHALSEDEDGDRLDEDGGWFDLGDLGQPEAGDYRTGYELLRVTDTLICVEAQGKHSSGSIETADLWFELPDQPEPGPALPPSETWYCWKELAVPGETEAPPETTPRLLTPHSDPNAYEQAIDYQWATPEEAIAWRDEYHRDYDADDDMDDGSSWILCRMTLTPVACPPPPAPDPSTRQQEAP